MTTVTESYARLADDSYRDGQLLEGPPYQILYSIDKRSGYHGVIYRNKETGDIVVAHRGTEFENDTLRDLVFTDGQMALLMLNQQLDGAREAVELALQLARKPGPNGEMPQVTVTGHSLGGALAQMTAAEYGLRGETFNAYGAAGLHGTPAGGNQVVNHVRATDMVSAAGRHFGSVRVYATEQDVALLLRDGAPPRPQPPLKFLKDVAVLNPGKTHPMSQFYGPGKIIRPENVAIYENHRADFGAYRDQIQETASLARSAAFLPPVSIVSTNLMGGYIAQKIVGAFDGNEELDRLRKEELREQRAPRYDPIPASERPPLLPARDRGPTYEQNLEDIRRKYGDDLGHGSHSEQIELPQRQTVNTRQQEYRFLPRTATDDYLDAYCRAAQRGDGTVCSALTRQYEQSPQAQIQLQAGRDAYQAEQQRAQEEEQRQMQEREWQRMQQQEQERAHSRGRSM